MLFASYFCFYIRWPAFFTASMVVECVIMCCDIIAAFHPGRNFTLFILLTKTTAARNDDALCYYTVRGLYFLAAVFVRSIVQISIMFYV